MSARQRFYRVCGQSLRRLIEKIVSGEGDNVVPLRAPAVRP
jgi:hypothetical protein